MFFKKLFLVLIYLLCSGCSKQAEKPPKPIILVTIPPYADLIKKIVADHAVIEIFVPPGANPHIYEPTPRQIKNFAQAKIWFRIGDPIEQKMVRLLQPRVQIVDLSKGYEEKDLHLWLNPMIALEQLKEITPALIHLFPETAAIFKENNAKLIDRLRQTDQAIMTKLTPFQGQFLLTSHPAFGYFCSRYGMKQLSIEVEGKDPLPKDISLLMDQLKTHPVPVVFIEPQYNNKGALLIADKLHLPVEEINPYDENYFGILEHLSETIVKYYSGIE